MKMLMARFLLTLFSTISLVGCAAASTSALSADPTATLVSTTLLIRLQNKSDVNFDNVVVRFPDKSEEQIVLAQLAAGETSAYFPLAAAYQSAEISASVAGTPYVREALDIAQESPILIGSYIYELTFDNERLDAAFGTDNDTQVSQVELLTKQLIGAGATVVVEPFISRGTPFDALWTERITTHALLTVNGERMMVYGFADAATAQTAADMVEVGGTVLSHTAEDATLTQEFLAAEAGLQPQWWQWEQFLVQMGEMQNPTPDTVAQVSRALATAPLHAATLSDGTVHIRLLNKSELDFESVTVEVDGRATAYGALPRGGLSAYQPLPNAYRYARITVWADGTRYEFMPTDFMGETPLAAGVHTYVLSLAEGRIEIGHLVDGDGLRDPALEGTWVWTNTQHADQTYSSPVTQEDEPPSITFTATPNFNQPGLDMHGYSGCNQMFGAYLLGTSGEIVTGGVGGTQMLCDEAVMESETQLLGTLRRSSYYRIEGDTLYIWNAGNAETLAFQRVVGIEN